MVNQKIILLVVLIVGYSASLMAQDYTVNNKSKRINDTKYSGYSINIIGSITKVTPQVYGYLKEKSKIRRKRNFYSITELQLEGERLDSIIIYLKIDDNEPSTTVWLGMKPSGLAPKRAEHIDNALQQELVLIARQFYVHQQELKIKEAETAAQIVSKKQELFIEENAQLNKELKEAEARKIELENLLETNRLSIEVLKQKLIDNTCNQDSVYLDLQKINKVIEGQKLKLKEID